MWVGAVKTWDNAQGFTPSCCSQIKMFSFGSSEWLSGCLATEKRTQVMPQASLPVNLVKRWQCGSVTTFMGTKQWGDSNQPLPHGSCVDTGPVSVHLSLPVREIRGVRMDAPRAGNCRFIAPQNSCVDIQNHQCSDVRRWGLWRVGWLGGEGRGPTMGLAYGKTMLIHNNKVALARHEIYLCLDLGLPNLQTMRNIWFVV